VCNKFRRCCSLQFGDLIWSRTADMTSQNNGTTVVNIYPPSFESVAMYYVPRRFVPLSNLHSYLVRKTPTIVFPDKTDYNLYEVIFLFAAALTLFCESHLSVVYSQLKTNRTLNFISLVLFWGGAKPVAAFNPKIYSHTPQWDTAGSVCAYLYMCVHIHIYNMCVCYIPVYI
jgi:hypothetical protein